MTYSLSGVTRNQASAALGGVTVKLFSTADDVLIASSVSDGSGAYAFTGLASAGPYYIVGYLDGSPDVGGTTLNTLTGVDEGGGGGDPDDDDYAAWSVAA